MVHYSSGSPADSVVVLDTGNHPRRSRRTGKLAKTQKIGNLQLQAYFTDLPSNLKATKAYRVCKGEGLFSKRRWGDIRIIPTFLYDCYRSLTSLSEVCAYLTLSFALTLR